jgi:two-component system capsular synthesis sensor histidine kinase RcsC
VGYFYALTPVYLGNRLQALLGVEQTIRMETSSRRAACRWA